MSPTRSRSFSPRCFASSLLRPSTFICPSVRLLVIDKWGNSSKCWNTIPTWERSLGRLVFGLPTDTPSTVISPFWNGSSALTHLMSVDFPDPDGPQTTTTSPLSTLVVQSVSTWNCPYHFDTPCIEIIDIELPPESANHGDLFLQPFHSKRQRIAEHEVDDRDEQVH